jgi:hypothetical protein
VTLFSNRGTNHKSEKKKLSSIIISHKQYETRNNNPPHNSNNQYSIVDSIFDLPLQPLHTDIELTYIFMSMCHHMHDDTPNRQPQASLTHNNNRHSIADSLFDLPSQPLRTDIVGVDELTRVEQSTRERK